MGLLDGKRLLITGVLTEASLGYGVAKLAADIEWHPPRESMEPSPRPKRPPVNVAAT